MKEKILDVALASAIGISLALLFVQQLCK